MAINSTQSEQLVLLVYGADIFYIMINVPDVRLCAITCEGIAEAIGMVKVDEQWKHNKKAIMPQIDYGKCVFCGLCVDACPFYALFMTNDYELSSFTKEHLIYTPAQLAIKPKYSGDVEIKIDDHGASHHG